MPREHRLVDRAGVVVQAAGDLEVGHHAAGHLAVHRTDHPVQGVQPLLQHVVVHAEVTHLLDERRVGGADPGQGDALVGHLVGQAEFTREQLLDCCRTDLVVLVDALQHGCRFLDAQAAVEPLGELAVVDVHRHGREPQLGVQPLQGLEHHQRGLDVVVLGQGLGADDVDVGLGELAVPTLLGAFATPHLLDLVAAKWEREVTGVLQNVACEWHGEVEVQPEVVVGVGLLAGFGVQPVDDVHLLVDLPLAGERFHRLHGAGVDRCEPMQFEGLLQDVRHMVLHHLALGQEFGKTGQRLETSHGTFLRDKSLSGWVGCRPVRRAGNARPADRVMITRSRGPSLSASRVQAASQLQVWVDLLLIPHLGAATMAG